MMMQKWAETTGDEEDVCDGPVAPALPVDSCEAGPDAFPNDAAASIDTDGDGMPDQLDGVSTTGLTEDLDDDNDTWTDLDEAACGPTDSNRMQRMSHLTVMRMVVKIPEKTSMMTKMELVTVSMTVQADL